MTGSSSTNLEPGVQVDADPVPEFLERLAAVVSGDVVMIVLQRRSIWFSSGR